MEASLERDIKFEVKQEIIAILNSSEFINKTSKHSSTRKKKISKDPSDEAVGGSPFPDFKRPSSAECVQVVDSLTAMHGVKETQNSIRPVLDALVRTILSQNTTDKTSMIAFQNLKAVCPTWKSVLAADDSVIEDAIRFGGLAEIKTKRIKIILRDIIDNYSKFCHDNEPSLEWMRDLSTADVKAKLGSYNGVGPKTISCVLMFAMERPEFPVDTHVWHITKKLGWVPTTCSRESCYEHLNNRVPDSLKFALHVLLVDHGKVCKACSKGGGGGGGKGKKIDEKDSAQCPLRRIGGSMPLPLSTPSPKSSTYTTADHSSAMAKIKEEYHIKDENKGSSDKDRAIKAEPGHHDKISMGLFPSDLKADPSLNSLSSSSSSKIVKKEVITVPDGNASVLNSRIRIKDESIDKKHSPLTTTGECSLAPDIVKRENESNTYEEDEALPSSAPNTSTVGRRRGRSAGTASDMAEDVVLVKRRGAILS